MLVVQGAGVIPWGSFQATHDSVLPQALSQYEGATAQGVPCHLDMFLPLPPNSLPTTLSEFKTSAYLGCHSILIPF